ncbi:MAG TPA: hypothetical protein VFR24_08545 [Candidatus Angelobacter sp.]|nr:hypothetical protein [Candidatus Angelobacter sp.]
MLLLPKVPATPQAAAQDLYAQSAKAELERDFNDPDLSYILLDENGQIMAQRWEQPDLDIPIGSLLKPFFAVAYGRAHHSFPTFYCAGKKTCWLPRGHGTLHIREAIAFSCNSYFHQLVANAGSEFRPAMEGFNLHARGERSLSTAAPLALARAYLELTRHAQEAEVSPVLEGMEISAQKGTAKAIAKELSAMTALAKTGTAPCTHAKKAPGDGFTLVMAPADHPRAVLLVRLHGRPGFMAADVAGRMIAKIEGSGAPGK